MPSSVNLPWQQILDGATRVIAVWRQWIISFQISPGKSCSYFLYFYLFESPSEPSPIWHRSRIGQPPSFTRKPDEELINDWTWKSSIIYNDEWCEAKRRWPKACKFSSEKYLAAKQGIKHRFNTKINAGNVADYMAWQCAFHCILTVLASHLLLSLGKKFNGLCKIGFHDFFLSRAWCCCFLNRSPAWQ